MTLREELIQVAAVAVAIVTDLDHGSTEVPVEYSEEIVGDIREERGRQEKKWGPQHHDVATWLAILGEEVGEASKSALDDFLFVCTMCGSKDDVKHFGKGIVARLCVECRRVRYEREGH